LTDNIFSNMKTTIRIASILIFLWSTLLFGPTDSSKKKTKAEQIKENWQRILEEQRVVDPLSSEGQVFQTEMLDLLKGRYPKHDFSKHPVQFLLLDQDRDQTEDCINAWTIQKDGVEYYAFSKGVIKKIKYRDTISWILGHEYEHRRYRESHGDKIIVEKGEEVLCDINALTTTIKNKENHSAVLEELAEKVFTRTRPTLSEFVDVHPVDQNRIRILQTKAGELITKEGYTAPPPTLWQSPTKAILSGAIHYSVIDKLKRDNHWEQLDNEKKLEAIRHFVEKEKDWNEAKISDLVKTFHKITVDRRNEKERIAQDKLANVILDSTHSIPTKIYDALSRTTRFLEPSYPAGRLHIGHDSIPLGYLIDVQKKLINFCSSTTSEQAKANASALNEALKQASKHFNNVHGIEFSNFEFPDLDSASMAIQKRKKTGKGKLVKVSWDEFVNWAKEDKSRKIMEALWTIEIHDPRLLETMSPKFAFEALKNKGPSILLRGILSSSQKQIIRGPHEGSTNIDGIKISEKGNVLGMATIDAIEELEKQKTDRLHHLSQAYASELLVKALNGDKKASALLDGLDIRFNEIVGLEVAYKNPRKFFNANLPAILHNSNSEQLIASEINKWLRDFTEEKREAIIELFKADPSYFFTPRIARGRHVSEGFNPNTLFSRILFDNANKLFKNKEETSKFLLALQDSEASGDLGSMGVPYYSAERSLDLRPLFRLIGATQPSTDEEANKFLKASKKTDFERYLIVCHLFQEIRKRGAENVKVDPLVFVQEVSQVVPPQGSDLARDINRTKLEPFVKKIRWPQDLNKSIDLWIMLHDKQLWKDALSEKKLKIIVDKVLEAQGEAKIKHIEKLLSADFIPFPRLRSTLESELTSTIVSEMGKDNSRKEYRQKLIGILNHLDSILGYAEKRNIFSDLANKTESQEACSVEFKNRLRLDNPEHIKGTTEKGAAIEFFKRIMEEVPAVRRDVQELLISNGDDKIIKETSDSIFLKSIDFLGAEDFQKILPFYIGKGARAERIFKEYASEKSRTLWVNFWSAPLEARAILYENLLFPKADTSLDKLQDGFDFVVNKLFPTEDPHSETSKRFMKAYFEVLDPTQRRIFIAASIVAAQKSHTSANKLSIGQRLALVFELLGPAEIKLGQAIHSHPDTPEDIREGVERLKAHAAPPERWELLEWIKGIPESERKQYKRIGTILGSGSYYVTVEMEMKDGSTQVLQILRPYSLERSQRGFDLLHQMGEKLHGIVEPETLSIVQEAIQQAHERAVPETNNQVAIQQFKLAKELYHGAKININGTEILLEVPDIHASGANYRRMTKGEGVHFNELPFETADQKIAKQNIAKAYLGYELLLILNGGHFDLDRHQAQMRVKKTGDKYILSLFDFGGLQLKPPTQEDREQLGRVIHDAFLELQKGSSLTHVIDTTIKNEKKDNRSVENLVRLQQAILALNDFKKYVSNEDLAEIIKYLQKKEMIHPEIQKTAIGRAFSSNTVAQFMQLLQKSNTSSPAPSQLCIEIERAILK
jgi:hypothetical protein